MNKITEETANHSNSTKLRNEKFERAKNIIKDHIDKTNKLYVTIDNLYEEVNNNNWNELFEFFGYKGTLRKSVLDDYFGEHPRNESSVNESKNLANKINPANKINIDASLNKKLNYIQTEICHHCWKTYCWQINQLKYKVFESKVFIEDLEEGLMSISSAKNKKIKQINNPNLIPFNKAYKEIQEYILTLNDSYNNIYLPEKSIGHLDLENLIENYPLVPEKHYLDSFFNNFPRDSVSFEDNKKNLNGSINKLKRDPSLIEFLESINSKCNKCPSWKIDSNWSYKNELDMLYETVKTESCCYNDLLQEYIEKHNVSLKERRSQIMKRNDLDARIKVINERLDNYKCEQKDTPEIDKIKKEIQRLHFVIKQDSILKIGFESMEESCCNDSTYTGLVNRILNNKRALFKKQLSVQSQRDTICESAKQELRDDIDESVKERKNLSNSILTIEKSLNNPEYKAILAQYKSLDKHISDLKNIQSIKIDQLKVGALVFGEKLKGLYYSHESEITNIPELSTEVQSSSLSLKSAPTLLTEDDHFFVGITNLKQKENNFNLSFNEAVVTSIPGQSRIRYPQDISSPIDFAKLPKMRFEVGDKINVLDSAAGHSYSIIESKEYHELGIYNLQDEFSKGQVYLEVSDSDSYYDNFIKYDLKTNPKIRPTIEIKSTQDKIKQNNLKFDDNKLSKTIDLNKGQEFTLVMTTLEPVRPLYRFVFSSGIVFSSTNVFEYRLNPVANDTRNLIQERRINENGFDYLLMFGYYCYGKNNPIDHSIEPRGNISVFIANAVFADNQFKNWYFGCSYEIAPNIQIIGGYKLSQISVIDNDKLNEVDLNTINSVDDLDALMTNKWRGGGFAGIGLNFNFFPSLFNSKS